MRRLLRNTLIVFTLCTATISAMVLVARTQPLPEHLAMLHLDQCAPPCWIGITPDRTMDFDQAEILIRSTYPEPSFKIEKEPNYNGLTIDYKIYRQSELVFQITLVSNTPDHMIYIIGLDFMFIKTQHYSFKALYSLLGEPTFVRVPSRSYIEGYYYPKVFVGLVYYPKNLSFNRLWSELQDMSHIVFREDMLEGLEDNRVTVKWQGFQSLQHYKQDLCATYGDC
jgi:hypothetical protein